MFSCGGPRRRDVSRDIWERTMGWVSWYLWELLPCMKAGMGKRAKVLIGKHNKRVMTAGDRRHRWLISEGVDMLIAQKNDRWSVDRSWRAFRVKMNSICLMQCQVYRWFTVFFFESLNIHLIFIWLMLLSAFDLFSHNNKHAIHFTRNPFKIIDGFPELNDADVMTCWYFSILSVTKAQCT